MIDTHAHVHTKAFDRDRAQVLARAFAAGVSPLLEVNIDATGWPLALEVARSDPRIYLSVGIHPHDLERAGPEDLDRLARELGNPRVRAVGETGLDYYRNYAPHGLQRAFFTRHVALARESGLPLVVHAREAVIGPRAFEDVLRILEEEGRGEVRGVLHCFSGDLEIARRAAGLGFLLGIGGAITYNRKQSNPLLASIHAELGTGAFVLETDCPYLSPSPHRNERNEPANIPVIAQALSEAIGVPRGEVERATDENAQALFRLNG